MIGRMRSCKQERVGYAILTSFLLEELQKSAFVHDGHHFPARTWK
jgi:hypothetical protein